MTENDLTQSAIDANSLCIECGLCCVGTLFSHIKVSPDEIEQVEDLGIRLHERGDETVFGLGCSCFKEGSCSVYEARPQKCVSFFCKLNKSVENGIIGLKESLKVVETVKKYTDLIINSIIPKDAAALHNSNYRLILIEYHKKSTQINARHKLTHANKKNIQLIFEQLKLIDHYFDNTLLLKRYDELIQSFPDQTQP